MSDWRLHRLASQLPADVAAVYFSLRWTDDQLRALEVPIDTLAVAKLTHHLDFAYWASRPPTRIFDLTPNEVLSNPDVHPAHTARIAEADLRWPVRMIRIHDTNLILDGLHRLARAAKEGVASLPCSWVLEPRPET